MLGLWRALERPVIDLVPGKIVNLEKFLGDPLKLSYHPEQIKTVRDWYTNSKDGEKNRKL
jgi:hypothetical protein